MLRNEDIDDIPDEEEETPTFCEECGCCDREDVLLLCDSCDGGYVRLFACTYGLLYNSCSQQSRHIPLQPLTAKEKGVLTIFRP